MSLDKNVIHLTIGGKSEKSEDMPHIRTGDTILTNLDESYLSSF